MNERGFRLRPAPEGSAFNVDAALTRCARGDRLALRKIYQAEAAKMVGVARRILNRRDLAEEAVQDCFVTIWQKANRYDPTRGSGRAWIYTILRHRALDILRDGRREDLVEDIESEETPVWEEAYHRLDAGGRLRQCLDELDMGKRQAVLMSYVVGFSHGEIAARLRVPLGTAKAWISRGVTALKGCLS